MNLNNSKSSSVWAQVFLESGEYCTKARHELNGTIIKGKPIRICNFENKGKGNYSDNNTADDQKAQETESLADSENQQQDPNKSPADKAAASQGQSKLDKQRHADNNANAGVNTFIPTTSNGLPDPSIYTKTDIDMMRKNTWSDAVFTVMMQEVA